MADSIRIPRNRPTNPKSIRYSGWRLPMVRAEYAILMNLLAQRPEHQGHSMREIAEAAIKAYATADELERSGLDKLL